jgi:4-amino-4-deoxy-L-arabinose transferase-like glycosyltransferase
VFSFPKGFRNFASHGAFTGGDVRTITGAPFITQGSHSMKTFRSLASAGLLIPLIFALTKLLLHLYTNAFAGYGYFRDELYYLACANNLSAGYVDQPPLSLFILAGWRALFGDSLFALRFLPALFGAATVFLTGLTASRLGGGRTAQSFACLAALLSLVWLGMSGFYSMNVFDTFCWTLAVYLVLRIVQTGRAHLWLPLAFTLGLGLLNKIGVLWLGFGIGVGLLLTEHRRWLRTIHPWYAAAIALALFSPFIIWNVTHGNPHLEFITNASGRKYGGLNPLDFVIGQVLAQNPSTLVLWICGLLALFFSQGFRHLRILGWIYLTAFLILLLNGHSKADYLSPIYGILFAAGGVAVEQWCRDGWRRHLRPALAVFMLAGLALVPYTLPILPLDSFIAYSRALPLRPPSVEGQRLGPLPQHYADMFGWEEKAMAVAKAWQSLAPADRARCAIFAENYGRCAAIDFYGKKFGLPPCIGKHNSYWMWGPRGHTGDLVIVFGGALEDKQEIFASVEIAGEVSNPYCMPYENHLRVYICRGLKTPLGALWPGLKEYI